MSDAPILVVDDDPTTRAIIAAHLDRKGIAATTCADGEEMWAALECHVPKVIVLDVQMPGDDGFSLAEKLRSRYGNSIAIIMLTSRDRAVDLATGMGVGADDYLIKPCDWKQLVTIVARNLSVV